MGKQVYKTNNAIVVGIGGIGMNVYIPQLEKLGYHVTTVDPNLPSNYNTVNEVPKTSRYDVAIVCCPNVHHLNAVLELTDVCETILVEKPGLANTEAWERTIDRFPNHKIVMVKNNLYRDHVNQYASLSDIENISSVEFNWLNKNRIPNPGGWFTNKEQAFGGVTHDLFPHLYCLMYAFFSFKDFKDIIPDVYKLQRWNLNNINKVTNYGVINKDGVYNVCDYAEAHYLLARDNDEPLPITLRASWKEGRDDQAIHIHYKNGGSTKFEFGLCPDYAYGRMIDDTVNEKFMGEPMKQWEELDLDWWIHTQLEYFNYED